MELEKTWNLFFVIFGLVAGLVKSLPMDMDSIKDGIQMGAIAGVGMAVDLAEKAHVGGSHSEKVSLGPLKMEKSSNIDAGLKSADDDDNADDRKRRRRSVVNVDEKQTVLFRSKRSPCFGRRRAQRTTTAAASGAGGEETVTQGPNPDDLRRRRKRSPDNDYEIDNNENIIPDQKTFSERTQEIGERFRQIVKRILDDLAGAFDKLKMKIQNGLSNSTDDMQ